MNDNQNPHTGQNSGDAHSSGAPRPDARPPRRGFFRRRPRLEQASSGQQASMPAAGMNPAKDPYCPPTDVNIVTTDASKADPALAPHPQDPAKANVVGWDEIHERKIPYSRPADTARRPVDTLKSYLESKDSQDRKQYDERKTKVGSASFVTKWEGKMGTPTRIIPIGGLEEVGGNSMILEYEDDMFVIDCGILFGGKDLPGVDFIIPDLSYVQQNRHKFRGFVITHGHLDHIGALPHVLPQFDFPPVYAPKLAIGFMKKHLEEAGLLKFAEKNIIEYDENTPIVMGKFRIEGFRVDHSLPDCFGLYVQTPTAKFIHTGDFRIDRHSLDQKHADYDKIAEIGNRGVDLLMSDSTNAIVDGSVPPEKDVIANLEKAIIEAEGRLIITTFSTLVTRLQKIIEISQRHGKKVYVNGRSMINNITLARDLGFITFEPGSVKRVTKHMLNVPDNQVVIVTTGSQGEELAGLTRIANGSHPVLALKESDVVIHSARIIPENTSKMLNVVNTVARKGAKIYFKLNSKTMFHTSGHAFKEDLKTMMTLTKPKHVMPLHGEYFMRQANAELAVSIGIPEKNTHMVDNGDVLELLDGEVRIIPKAVQLTDLVIEKGTIGQVTDPVFKERLTMKENGVMVVLMKIDRRTRRLVAQPKIISRGFLFKNVAQERGKDLSQVVRTRYDRLLEKFSEQKKQKDLVYALRADLSRWILDKYEKSPIVMPVFIEQ